MPLSPRNFPSTINVYPVTTQSQETGGAENFRGTTPTHANVPCKIDFLVDANIRSFGAAEVQVSHQILTPVNVEDVNASHVLIDEDQRLYRVEHVANEGDRDELWSIFCNRQD